MAHRPSLFLRLAIVMALGLGVASCESLEKLNPFEEKKPPLPGERKPVFPNGVPGVTYTGPVAQPANSNVDPTALQPQQQPGGTNQRN
ncbi:hypothetical protein J5J86_04445 [Aquabacter sp. L1I39]|uniref:hypothetical protein n=1 Tax=Aquabacter sp. L1I39 TaxID=2820278 RepID=UPI001AD987D4|nr:hypothetical protein [Aquabacter sp. L1I39]QTL04592.1 hypothetical protein J5J86_04445 [Aquabacter sp. L1I39]